MARGEIRALVQAAGVSVSAAAPALSSRYRVADATGWNGTAYTVTYDVSSFTDDAPTCIWEFQDTAGNSYAQTQGCVIDFPTGSQVRVTFGSDFPPSAGTYYLVGV